MKKSILKSLIVLAVIATAANSFATGFNAGEIDKQNRLSKEQVEAGRAQLRAARQWAKEEAIKAGETVVVAVDKAGTIITIAKEDAEELAYELGRQGKIIYFEVIKPGVREVNAFVVRKTVDAIEFLAIKEEAVEKTIRAFLKSIRPAAQSKTRSGSVMEFGNGGLVGSELESQK